jgi:hypothetical protein
VSKLTARWQDPGDLQKTAGYVRLATVHGAGRYDRITAASKDAHEGSSEALPAL